MRTFVMIFVVKKTKLKLLVSREIKLWFRFFIITVILQNHANRSTKVVVHFCHHPYCRRIIVFKLVLKNLNLELVFRQKEHFDFIQAQTKPMFHIFTWFCRGSVVPSIV